MHKQQLDNLDLEDEAVFRRNAADTEQVLEQAIALGANGHRPQAQALLQSRGIIDPPLESALKGMPWIEYMQVWHPDHLNMFGKGILERACRELLNTLEDAALNDIAHQLDVRQQHSFRPYEMPFGGVSAIQNRITTKQRVMLVRALVVPWALHSPPTGIGVVSCAGDQGNLGTAWNYRGVCRRAVV